MSNSSAKDQYFVAAKLLIRDQSKLLITHDVFNDWDLPGGRIKVDEFETSLESIIDRKVKEELGSEIKLKIKNPVVFFRHERVEHSSGQPVRIFAVGYEADYLGGQIELGAHHDKFEWVDLESFNPKEYFTGGWLKGIQEYSVKGA